MEITFSFCLHGGSVEAKREKALNTQGINGHGAKGFSNLGRMGHWCHWHYLLHQQSWCRLWLPFVGWGIVTDTLKIIAIQIHDTITEL